MGKITFILGGARSGKSAYALSLAKKNKKAAYIATAQACDSEMAGRIRMHKRSRPKAWVTFEEPLNIPAVLQNDLYGFKAVIIDCLTIWISNLLLKKKSQAHIEKEAGRIISCLKNADYDSYLVANEVGLGIVPDNELGRLFRDVAGRVNQIVAVGADEVFFVVAGLVTKLK